MSEYQKLLSCWHKLEHYSPAAVPKGDIIKELSSNSPWDIPLKPSIKGNTIEYTIYLGVFNSTKVIDFVKDFFKDTTEEINQRGGNICIASLKIDILGKYIPNSLGISTLPWALRQLEKKKIDNDDIESSWQEILDFGQLRNCMAHSNGIAIGSRENLVKYVESKSNLSYDKGFKQITVTKEYLLEMSKTCFEYLDKIMERVWANKPKN